MYDTKQSRWYFTHNEWYVASGTFGANRPNINNTSSNLTEGMGLQITPLAKGKILRCDHTCHPLKAHTLADVP